MSSVGAVFTPGEVAGGTNVMVAAISFRSMPMVSLSVQAVQIRAAMGQNARSDRYEALPLAGGTGRDLRGVLLAAGARVERAGGGEVRKTDL